jgi:hypothetical protein
MVMKRTALWLAFAVMSLANTRCFAESSLSQWAADFAKPEVQQKILNRIFSDQIGPVSAAVLDKTDGTYNFPNDNSWVRLGKDVVYSSASASGPYLVVSCTLTHAPDQPPVNATSYLFHDMDQRPVAISAGYAARERLEKVTLPKLGKTFLLLLDSSNQGGARQGSASLLDLEGPGMTDHPRAVWSSPNAARSFKLGFDDLGGKVEDLVLQVDKGNEVGYSAYRWNGSRFEPDDFVFENRLEALPDSVWKYGTNP